MTRDPILSLHPEARDHELRRRAAHLAALSQCAAGCPCPATATVRVTQPDTLARIDYAMCLYHAAVLESDHDGQYAPNGDPIARVVA